MIKKTPYLIKLIVLIFAFCFGFSLIVYASTATIINEIINIISQNPIFSKDVLDSLRDLAGYKGERLFLVFIADSSESRVLGGFTGWVVLVKTKDGSMTIPKVFPGKKAIIRVYDLEKMLPKDKMLLAPIPANRFSKWWGLRETLNWPDFPYSATWTRKFYEWEVSSGVTLDKPWESPFSNHPWPDSLKKIDGVVVISSEVFKEFIKMTGPIRIHKTYSGFRVDDDFNYNNFDYLINWYSNGYNNGGWHPRLREVFDDIVNTVYERLDKASPVKQYQFVTFLLKMLNRKDILICSFNSRVEKTIKFLGWGGEIKTYLNDYLGVFDAGHGSYLTRTYTSRRINYKVFFDGNDAPIGKIEVIYRNGGRSPISGKRFNWFNNRSYNAYIKVYVPNGVKYVDSGYASFNKIFIDRDPLDQKPSWKHVGPDLGLQFHRTFFGGWFKVPPGKTKKFWFKYKLPGGVIKTKGRRKVYRLFFQKQAGTRTEDFWFTFIKPRNARILTTSIKPFVRTRKELIFKFSTELDRTLLIEYR